MLDRTQTALPRCDARVPPRAGVGLKSQHFEDILQTRPDIGFFEIHAENYMGQGGAPHHYLERIRALYPLSVHGVGLSIGGENPLNMEHLQRLKQVVERYQPGLFSEHLAWSSHDEAYLNDLLPVPYTKQTLDRVCDHIDQVQEVVGRQMLLENPSTYVRFGQDEMQEVDFLCQIATRTGCGLLLDVNNVQVSASNHNYCPLAYIDAFPLHHIGEIHMGGHAVDEDEAGHVLLIDDHGSAVADKVWQLYNRLIDLAGPRPTLIEWDNDVPEWSRLLRETKPAERKLRSALPIGSRHAYA